MKGGQDLSRSAFVFGDFQAQSKTGHHHLRGKGPAKSNQRLRNGADLRPTEPGISIAKALIVEKKKMNALDVAKTTEFVAVPDLEVPMINNLVSCLAREHTKLDEQILQLALAATRLEANPKDDEALGHATDVWQGIRGYLWSHLQIEDELVLTWGEAHHAIAGGLGETLARERPEMRGLLAALGSHGDDRGAPRNFPDRKGFAQSLLALSRMLATHVERYEGEVLPAIQRALFHA